MDRDLERRLCAMFVAASNRIGDRWNHKTAEWAKTQSPADQVAMLVVTDMLNEAWKAVQLDSSLVPQFEDGVKRWEQVHFQAIQNYERANP